jgi:hypothetical protein
MFDAQKLMQRLSKVQHELLKNALDPVPDGRTVDYEFGRRIGYKTGVDHVIQNVYKFLTEDEKDEKSNEGKGKL